MQHFMCCTKSCRICMDMYSLLATRASLMQDCFIAINISLQHDLFKLFYAVPHIIWIKYLILEVSMVEESTEASYKSDKSKILSSNKMYASVVERKTMMQTDIYIHINTPNQPRILINQINLPNRLLDTSIVTKSTSWSRSDLLQDLTNVRGVHKGRVTSKIIVCLSHHPFQISNRRDRGDAGARGFTSSFFCSPSNRVSTSPITPRNRQSISLRCGSDCSFHTWTG